ncbi:MAG TPA: phosphotransferase [Pseudomonadales bacterium]
MTNIPRPEELDAAWFTAALRKAGHQRAEVVGVERRQIGTGQIGACYRYSLTLGSADASIPVSFVGKFPSDDELSRATGVQLRNYYREVQFYRLLADELQISVPRCYYADIDGEGPDFLLLLEDLAPAVQGDQLAGCGAEVARSAVLELVGLQAPSWCREELKRYDWLHAGDLSGAAMVGLYAQLLPGFLDRYGEALAADERRIIAKVAESPGCPLFQPVSTPFCLEHVDYRLDNMLIDARQTPPAVSVVDWQSVRIGKPMNDVAYFLGAGMLPDARRRVEQDIVRDYHAKLTETGIEGYPWAQCWDDYRRGSFSGFGVTVVASMIVQQTERGDRMFITMARRHARHALDMGAEAFLSA